MVLMLHLQPELCSDQGEQGEDEEMDEAEADLLPDPSTSAVSPQLAQDGNPESVGAGNKRKADDGVSAVSLANTVALVLCSVALSLALVASQRN